MRTRLSRSTRRSFPNGSDGLVVGGLLEDDSADHPILGDLRQEKGEYRHIVIDIEELDC